MGAGPGRLISGFERPPIGGSWRAEDLGILIGRLPVHKVIDGPCPTRPRRKAERARARARRRVGAVPSCLAAHTRGQWASRERRRSPRGGGAGAAWQPPYGSVEPPAASGTGAAGSGRQRPALQRVRTSRLLPPSFLRPPASRAATAEQVFLWDALRLGRGLEPNILAGPKAWRLLRLRLTTLVRPPNTFTPDPDEWRSAPFSEFR